MSEYSIIEFLKSLNNGKIEKEIIELLFSDLNDDELLNDLLKKLKENE